MRDTLRKTEGRYLQTVLHFVLTLVLLYGSPPLALADTAFPIRVTDNGRHLQDASGTPFTIHGFASWSLLTQLSIKDVESYLENRRNKGFNTVIVNLLSHKFSDNAPKNYYGVAPFTTGGDFSTPNDTYFTHGKGSLTLHYGKAFWYFSPPATSELAEVMKVGGRKSSETVPRKLTVMAVTLETAIRLIPISLGYSGETTVHRLEKA
jgi:hypothetical protein